MYISQGARNLSDNGLAISSAKLLPKGSVLFSSRAPIGYVAIASNMMATSQGFKSFVLPEGIDSRFVYYYLRYIKPIAEEQATGTTFKELSGSNAARLPLVIAPYGEQQRIADKLDALLGQVDACRARLERVPGIVKGFRKAVLAAAMNGCLTADWRSCNPENIDSQSVVFAIRGAHHAAGGHKVGNAAPPTEGVHDLTRQGFPESWDLLDLRGCLKRLGRHQ